MLVAGLDVEESPAGGSSAGRSWVRAWVADVERPGEDAVVVVRDLAVLRRGTRRAELDPVALEQACRGALEESVARAGRPGRDYLGVTVSSMRRAFVLLDAAGRPLGDVVLDSDRRGAPFLPPLEGAQPLTGHRPAPELTLPKLLAVQAEEPGRWASTTRVLFLHDWLAWRLSGTQATEVSYACAGGMADVAARTWATALLDDVGVGTGRLAPVVEPGTVVGELVDGWPLPAALPVVAGCGDLQVAALSAGGLHDGVVSVVAGSASAVAAGSTSPVRDPLARTRSSTHALPGWWLAEGGRAGDGRRPASPGALHPGGAADPLLAARAFGVRAQVEDLERVLGRAATAVVVTGAPSSGELPDLLAAVLGRDVHVHAGPRAPRGGAHLVARAVGAHSHLPGPPPLRSPAGDAGAWQAAYSAWARATAAPEV